jgi:hypothetical protein
MKNISAISLIGWQRNVSEILFVLVQVPQREKSSPLGGVGVSSKRQFPAIRRPCFVLLTNPTSASVAPSGCITTSCTYLFLMRDLYLNLNKCVCMHSGFAGTKSIVSAHVPRVSPKFAIYQIFFHHLIRSESDIPHLSNSAIFETSQRQLEQLHRDCSLSRPNLPSLTRLRPLLSPCLMFSPSPSSSLSFVKR